MADAVGQGARLGRETVLLWVDNWKRYRNNLNLLAKTPIYSISF